MTNIQLPPDPEGMNDSRAAWAGQAIHNFGLMTGTGIVGARVHYEAETLAEDP